jgi:hypothetical protein
MTQPIQVPHALESICPSCGKVDKTLWPEGCNNEGHKEEWTRLQQENAKLREARDLYWLKVQTLEERIALLEASK